MGLQCHKARILTQWFNDRHNFQVIKRSDNSLNLNPIENVCHGKGAAERLHRNQHSGLDKEHHKGLNNQDVKQPIFEKSARIHVLQATGGHRKLRDRQQVLRLVSPVGILIKL
jgi:hypothetical protein